MKIGRWWRYFSLVSLVFGLVAGFTQAQETGRQFSIRVDGLACPFCAYGVEKRLNAVVGVAEVKIDIASGTVTVTMLPGSTLDEATAGKAVEAAGFTMRSFSARAAGK